MTASPDEFEFVIRSKITCWFLYCGARDRDVTLQAHPSLSRIPARRLWNELHAYVANRSTPIKWTIRFVTRNDGDLETARALRDIAVGSLTSEQREQRVATKVLTKLVAKLDTYLEVSIVDRLAALA